jgi:hypothetical protein
MRWDETFLLLSLVKRLCCKFCRSDSFQVVVVSSPEEEVQRENMGRAVASSTVLQEVCCGYLPGKSVSRTVDKFSELCP